MHRIIKPLVFLACLGAAVFFVKVKLSYFMRTSPYFNLRDINISGERYVAKEDILIRSSLQRGANIFKIDIADAARNIEGHPLVKEAIVLRRLPDAVDIKIKERNQVAYIMLGKKYGLDEEGVVLPLPKEEFALPVVTGILFARVIVGEKLDLAGVKSALNVLNAMREARLSEYIDISEINVVKPGNPVLYTSEEKTEIRLGNFPLRSQLDSLKLILSDLRDKGASAEYIDLRFGKKIVVREKKE